MQLGCRTDTGPPAYVSLDVPHELVNFIAQTSRPATAPVEIGTGIKISEAGIILSESYSSVVVEDCSSDPAHVQGSKDSFESGSVV